MSSSCVDVEAIFAANLFAIDALEVSLATIFGLILGIIIALICSKCFFRELAKDRVRKINHLSLILYIICGKKCILHLVIWISYPAGTVKIFQRLIFNTFLDV